jgi:Glycosyltransferases involved in cell wall biogenesis
MRGQDAPTAESPTLTIGMPVYNNAPTLRRALTSLLDQSYSSFRLLVSDDGSTDATWQICEEYAERDRRVRCVRQPTNLNYGNFRWVLAQADTPYFMFAAGDDRWHPDFPARMISALDADPAAVCAVSQVAFDLGDDRSGLARGTRALTGTPEERVVDFLAGRDDNSRMYGVLRTPVAKRGFPPGNFFAYDWAFSIGTLLEGTHIEIPEVLLWRDLTEPARYIEYVRRDAGNPLERVFPLLPLTKDLLERLAIPRTRSILRELARSNIVFHIQYLRRYHPRIARIVEPFVRRAGDPVLSVALRFWHRQSSLGRPELTETLGP